MTLLLHKFLLNLQETIKNSLRSVPLNNFSETEREKNIMDICIYLTEAERISHREKYKDITIQTDKLRLF